MDKRRLIVAITGASGSIFGVRILETLKQINDIETHLILSESGILNIKHELDMSVNEVEAMADTTHDINNSGASIASGSYKTSGMIIAPCSVKTLSSVTYSLSMNLIIRAADVCLKERRKLVLMVRETPLHSGHLKSMLEVSNMGAIIMPPVPALYTKPKSIDEMVNHLIGRALGIFNIEANLTKRWGEDIPSF